MKKSLISIIIPVYNKEKYLEELFQSLIQQTLKEYECIIIDDGSIDSSGRLCDFMAKKDSRFLVYHIKNRGVSHARNYGIDKANGKYITFIDADDTINPNYLFNLVHLIESANVDIVISAYKKVWGNASKVICFPYKSGIYLMKDLMSSFATVQKELGIYGCCVAKIFKKEKIADVRFDETIKLAEDFDFYLKLYSKINDVYIDDKAYYYYRQEADNSSTKINDYDIDYLTQLKINLKYRKFLKLMGFYINKNKKIVDQLISDYVFFSLYYCPYIDLNKRIETVYSLYKHQKINLIKNSNLKKMLFLSLEKNNRIFIKAILLPYIIKRRIFRR